MTRFHRFQGNFNQVWRAMGLPLDMIHPTTVLSDADRIAKDLGTVNRDLPATNFYVEREGDAREVVALRNEVRHKCSTDQTQRYIQGQMYGGCFGGSLFSGRRYNEIVARAIEADNERGLIDQLHVVYPNDNGVLSGFSIDYLRDDDTTNEDGTPIAPEQRSCSYVITIIRNPMAAPEDRQVFSFFHSGLRPLLSDQAAQNGADEDIPDIMDRVRPLLNSKEISKLLDGLTVNNQLSLEKFSAVKETLKKKRNYHSFYEALLDFEHKIKDKPAHLHQKGCQLADVFRTIIANEQHTAGLDDLVSVSIQGCTHILDHLTPGDTDYQAHLKGLVTVSEKLSQRANPLWKRLAAALLGFAGAALVVLGVIAVIPTAGASIAAIIGGVASMVGAAALLASGDAKDQKLSSSVAFFKAAVEKERKTPTPAAVEEHSAENPLLAATTGVKP